MTKIQDRRRFILAVAGSVMFHLLLLAAIFLTHRNTFSGGSGVLEVFLTGGKSTLMVSQTGDSKPPTRNETRREIVNKAVPQIMLKAKQTKADPVEQEEPADMFIPDGVKERPAPAEKVQSIMAQEGPVPKISGLERVDPVGPVSGHASYIGVFGGGHGPRFREQVMPIYPQPARRRGKEDNVVLKLMIDETGRLTDLEVVKKAGFGLDQAAVNAVKASTFLPASMNGDHVKSETLLTVRFVLE